MNTLKIVKIMLSFCALLLGQNSDAFLLPAEYLSGESVCEKHREDRTNEIGKYVSVPVDYKNRFGEKTLIYTYTKKAFDKTLPTLIYFTGGPGVSSRSTEFDLPNTNIIFFEQRGISCSRPKTLKLFLDPKFYSSLNTANDALEIIKSYGINKVTSYGQSYGTVPATIFASIFPNNTESLILEGVIFKADESLWNSEIKKNLLQNLFSKLDKEKQERILKLSNDLSFPKNWFSKVSNMIFYLNEGVDVFDTYMSGLLTMDDDSLRSFVANFYAQEKIEEEFSFGDVMMGMIGCQELSMAKKELSMTMIFNQGILEYDHENEDYKSRCMPLYLTDAQDYSSMTYDARNYQVSSPVFYLLGENDGATDLNQGLSHARSVPLNQKEILVMNKGGHLPSLSFLKENRACDESDPQNNCESLIQNKLMVQIFEKIIHEKVIDNTLIDEFNAKGPSVWHLNN